MKRIKLTKRERKIEDALLKAEYVKIKGKELKMIDKSLKLRRKDVTMTIRVNSEDIKKIKKKAEKIGIKYQSYISEILRQVAQ